MRALVIAPQPFFSPRGTPFSVYYRTLVTSELGVEIDLLTYGEGQDVDLAGVRTIRIPRFRFLGPVKVGPSWKKLFLDVFILLWTIGLLLRRRYAFVHAHEESVFFVRFLAPIFRFRFVYDMHSSLAQQLTNFGFTRSRLLIGLFEGLENTCLRKAAAVITICPELARYARERLPEPERHFLIENSVFDEVRLRGASSADPPPPLPELPPDRPIVLYAGTFEKYQGIDVLLRGFAAAHRERPDAFLLLLGGSPEQVQEQRELAESLGIGDDCRFTGRVPQALVKEASRRASVLTSPRVEGTNTPLKIYEQLASGRPLVATRIPSHTQVLDDEVCFLADPEPEAIGRAVIAALTGGEERDRRVRAARELYDRAYSRAAYEGKMRRLLEVLR